MFNLVLKTLCLLLYIVFPSLNKIRVKMANILRRLNHPINYSDGEHAFPLTGFVCRMAHVTQEYEI